MTDQLISLNIDYGNGNGLIIKDVTKPEYERFLMSFSLKNNAVISLKGILINRDHILFVQEIQ